MPFQKGNKYGGKRAGAGRPTKEAMAIKQAIAEKYWAEVEERIEKLFERYFREKGSARDVINRVVPYAKTGVEHSGEIGCYRIDAFDPNNPDKKREG
jgi:hypothetical protein